VNGLGNLVKRQKGGKELRNSPGRLAVTLAFIFINSTYEILLVFF
jgi:hypothetical protein